MEPTKNEGSIGARSKSAIKSAGLILVFPLTLVLGRAVALLALAGGVIAYIVSPGFRRWFEERSATAVSGVRMQSDGLLGKGHAWVRGGRRAAVGADDLLLTALGPPDAVHLPLPGARVAQNEVLFTLQRQERRIEVRSPVSGTVIEVNESLADNPETVATSPYREGWIVRLRRDNLREGRLLRGGLRARRWFRAEVGRFLASLTNESLVLQDGGQVVPNLYRQIDDPTWHRIKREVLSGPGV